MLLQNGKTMEHMNCWAYDVRYGIWTKEDALEVVSAVFYKNRLYAATRDAVYEFDAHDQEEPFFWEAVSIPQDEGTFEDKGANELRIRAKIPREPESGYTYPRMAGRLHSKRNFCRCRRNMENQHAAYTACRCGF